MPAFESVVASIVHCDKELEGVCYGSSADADSKLEARGKLSIRERDSSADGRTADETENGMYNDALFNAFARTYEARSEVDMSMADYLESCRGDPMRYANAAER